MPTIRATSSVTLTTMLGSRRGFWRPSARSFSVTAGVTASPRRSTMSPANTVAVTGATSRCASWRARSVAFWLARSWSV